MPYGLFAIREYDGIRIKKDSGQKADREIQNTQILLNIPGETTLPSGGVIKTSIFSADEIKDIDKIPDKTCTKWFDYDIIKGPIFARNRQSGDYMVVCADGGTKKLKELFIHEKVLQQQRNNILLLTQDQLVLWAVGVRMGEYGKVSSKTKQVLEIKYMEEKRNE